LGGNNTLFYDAIELVGGGKSKTTVEDYWSGEIKWLSGGDIASNHKSIIISSEKKLLRKDYIVSIIRVMSFYFNSIRTNYISIYSRRIKVKFYITIVFTQFLINCCYNG
jgi:hypothetical protein